jgi:hypothetical protein
MASLNFPTAEGNFQGSPAYDFDKDVVGSLEGEKF